MLPLLPYATTAMHPMLPLLPYAKCFSLPLFGANPLALQPFHFGIQGCFKPAEVSINKKINRGMLVASQEPHYPTNDVVERVRRKFRSILLPHLL